MGKQLINFEDGSLIEWEDRETIRYIEGRYSALIWVDFEPGFFSRGRIIRTSSIDEWELSPDEVDKKISASKKMEIINKIEQLYKKQNGKYVFED